MKKLFSIFAIAALMLTFAVGSSNAAAKKAMKEHACSAACKDGKHVYAHGEKGHKCGKECKEMMEKEHKEKSAK